MQEIIVDCLLAVVAVAAAVMYSLGKLRSDITLRKKQKKMLVRIFICAVIMLVLQFLPAQTFDNTFGAAGRWVRFGAYFVDYLIIGADILKKAVKGVINGSVFDENFLMALATVGAWAIGSFDEAVGVMLFYRVGEYFEDRAVERSRKQIMAAVDLRPETVNLVEEDGNIRTLPAEDAAVGDIVLVRPGDRVPLDGEVVEGESRLDTSAVTGEPVPVRVAAGDRAISGCVNTDGAIKLRVTHVLAESMVQRILDSVENAAARKPKIDRFITRFSRIYTPAVVGIALLTAIVPSLVTGNWSQWVYTALTFLVISCPCALVLSVPLTYFAGIGAGSRRGILFKGGASLEALNNVKTVVMDKTGTITKGNFVVQDIVPANGAEIDQNELLWLAAACECASTHPIAKSILAAYETRKEAAAKADRPSLVLVDGAVENIREQAGEGVEATLDGKTVLCGNRKLMARHGIDLSGYQGTPGSTEVLLAADGRYIGHIAIADTIKADAQQAVARLKAQGLTTAMLTGDVDACALWSPESLTVLEQVEGTTKLADNMTFSDTSISLASWIAMPDRVESERDMFVRFVTALFEGMDYSADEHYDEVAQWVADLLAIDYESAYNQRGDAEWLTGKEVYDGIADGTVAGYYELQQEIMISSGNLESEVPVEDYVAFDIMTEAGDALYGEAAA